MKSIVGYTGFVGSNIVSSAEFENLYNSKNIESAYSTNPDLLVYSGVRAEKYLANKEPDIDKSHIDSAINNIKKIDPKLIVLISTVDVYKNPVNVDESTPIDIDDLQPYGKNRYILEQWVESVFDRYLIVRLPGLFGKNIKKNFIYDMINIIPSMLSAQKYEDLCSKDSFLNKYYHVVDNGFYKCIQLDKIQKDDLKKYFIDIGFSALNFTDSRAVFQFYNLSRLWADIRLALDAGLKKINLAVEPVSAAELYLNITGKKFVNHILDNPPIYDFKTLYCDVYGGDSGYIMKKNDVIEALKIFITEGCI